MLHKKEKKPFDLKKTLTILCSIVLFLLICGAIGGGLAAYTIRVAGDNDALAFAYIFGGMLMLYAAFFLQIILHEGGHMVGGLLTGYTFVSFNILGFIWTKGQDGKLRRGRMQIAGAGGQCLMCPPEYDGGRFPFTLYNMGGVIANVIVAAICLLLAILAKNLPLLYLFFMMMGVVGLAFALLNGLPLPMETLQNDGKNQLCIMKDTDARRAFWVQMNIAAANARGKRLKQMPAEWFQAYPEDAMNNPIISSIAVMEANRRMDSLDLAGAEAAIRKLLAREKGIVGLHRMILTCDGATCELVAGRPADLTEALDTKENKQMMKAMKGNPSIIRTQYAVALLKEKAPGKAEKLLKEFEAAAKKYPNPQDVASECEVLLAIQNATLNGGIHTREE